MKKTEKDIKKKRKDFADTEVLLRNGNYYVDYDVSIWYKLTWLIDLFLTNLFYVITAIVLGWVVDDFLVKSLNTDDGKAFIFAQACGQFLYLFVVFYFIVYFYGHFLPSVAINPPPEHKYTKMWVSAFLAIAAIFTIEPKLVDKLDYVFYNRTPS
jgi:hypothetical protein